MYYLGYIYAGMKNKLLIICSCFIWALSAAQTGTNLQWTWMKGNNTIAGTGIYGAKGISSAANTPGARQSSVSWTDLSGNLWLFGGQGYAAGTYGSLNDLWKYNSSTNEWTWMKGENTIQQYGIYGTRGISSTSNKPGARVNSASWSDASGNLWLFGGYGRASGDEGRLNDLWKYNTNTNEWIWINGDNAPNEEGVYGTKGTSSAFNKPGAREYCIAWTDASGNIWLFGGYGQANNQQGLLNDLWKYNSSNNEWTWISGDNSPGIIGMYGTQGVSSASNNPGARVSGVSWMGESGILWLFGGYRDTASLNDLWKYNTNNNEWTWVKGGNTLFSPGIYGTQGTVSDANTPGGRGFSTGWKDPAGDLWLFGGERLYNIDFVIFNDLWKYNTLLNAWTWVKGDNLLNVTGIYGTKGITSPVNKPGGKRTGNSWIDAVGNPWLFGGFGFDTNGSAGNLNDLWKISGIAVVPLILQNVSATIVDQKQVLISWQTAQEINTDRFIIERSADSRNFTSLGSVRAAGNSSLNRSYSFTDQQPLPGITYYRLKMMDVDGKFNYSLIRLVNFNSFSSLSITPNPVKNVLQVTYPSDEASTARPYKATVNIYSSTMQLVQTIKVLQAGRNMINIPVERLAPGIYFLQFVNDGGVRTAKFLKE